MYIIKLKKETGGDGSHHVCHHTLKNERVISPVIKFHSFILRESNAALF